MDIIDKNTFVGLAKEIYKITLLFPKKEPLRNRLRQAADDLLADFVMEENDYADNLRRGFILTQSYLEIAADQNWVAPDQIEILKEKIKRTEEDFFAAESSMQQEWKEIAESVAPEVEKEASASQAAGERDFILIPTAPKTEIIAPLPQDLMMPQITPLPSIDEEAILPDETEFASESIANEEIGEDEKISDVSGENVAVGAATLTAAQIERQNRILEFLKEKGCAQVWEIQNIFPNVSKRTIRRDFRAMLEQGLIERTGERNTTAYKLKTYLS